MKHFEKGFKKRLMLLALFLGIVFVGMAAGPIIETFDLGALSFLDFSGLSAGGMLSTASVALIWMEGESFKEITHEQFEELDDTQKMEYHKALTKHRRDQTNKLQKQVKDLQKAGGDNTEEITKLQKQIAALDLSKIESLEKIVLEQGKAMKRLLEGNARLPKSARRQINAFIKDNAAKIKQLKTEGHGHVEFTVKVPEDITTGSATNPDGIPELVGTQVAPAGNINLNTTIIDELVSKFDTGLSAYPYTESVPKDGNYDFIAEGTIKPEMDFKIETRYAEPKKLAAHTILTEESVTDIRGLQSIATDYLRKKHDLKRQNGLLFGDGLDPSPKGATVYGRLFSAGDMALQVADPNFMDVVNACIVDIATTHNYQDEMPYRANIVMVNFTDFFLNLVSAKDAQGHPLYPSASLFGKVVIGGVTIIPFDDIPAGKIFVADMKMYNVSTYVDYTVRIGWINDQFIYNKFTMVGESRLHAFVKKLDEQAFIYDDIATIKTAITKP